MNKVYINLFYMGFLISCLWILVWSFPKLGRTWKWQKHPLFVLWRHEEGKYALCSSFRMHYL